MNERRNEMANEMTNEMTNEHPSASRSPSASPPAPERAGGYRIEPRAAPRYGGPIVAAGILLGIGLGGFLDGIVLHQILQWHNMLSSVVVPVDLISMKVNMVWDGIFHLFTWLMTASGLFVLWRAGWRRDVPWSTQQFTGSLLLGWGLFNLVEGIIDHHLLAIHHVHPGVYELVWDLGFLAFGALLSVIGAVRLRRANLHVAARGGGLLSA